MHHNESWKLCNLLDIRATPAAYSAAVSLMTTCDLIIHYIPHIIFCVHFFSVFHGISVAATTEMGQAGKFDLLGELRSAALFRQQYIARRSRNFWHPEQNPQASTSARDTRVKLCIWSWREALRKCVVDTSSRWVQRSILLHLNCTTRVHSQRLNCNVTSAAFVY